MVCTGSASLFPMCSPSPSLLPPCTHTRPLRLSSGRRCVQHTHFRLQRRRLIRPKCRPVANQLKAARTSTASKLLSYADVSIFSRCSTRKCLRRQDVHVSWYVHEYLKWSSLHCLKAACSSFYALRMIWSGSVDDCWASDAKNTSTI